MRLYGNPENLNCYPCEAQAITDTYVTESHIYVQSPTLAFNERTSLYEEIIRLYAAPKNLALAEKMVEEHNRIYHSPLMKALREEV
jgi:hypothetical protein